MRAHRILALAIACASISALHAQDPASGDAEPVPAEEAPAVEDDTDDIMKDIAAERERQKAAEEQEKAQARQMKEQQRAQARAEREAAEDKAYGEIIAAVPLTVHEPENPNSRIQASAKLYRGDDPAAASFRFCEKYNLLNKDTLLSIAGQLKDKMAEVSPEYEPAEGAHLKSAGAHNKRAKQYAKDGEHDMAVIDTLRALSRKGLEEDAVAKMERALLDAFRGLKGQREQEKKDARAAKLAAQRKIEAEKAMEEARKRKERDEEDWASFFSGLLSEAEGGEAETLAEVQLTLTKNDAQKSQSFETARVVEGSDQHTGAFEFCSANGMVTAEQVAQVSGMLKEKLDQDPTYQPPKEFSVSPQELLSRGKQARKEGKIVAAGADFTRVLTHTDATPAEKQESSQLAVAMMNLQAKLAPFQAAAAKGEWSAALKMLDGVAREERSNVRLLLLEARCHQQLGAHANAHRAAARVVEVAASYASWQRGEPRMMAVNVGANAAMELGNSEKAIRFYKTVLKYDPEQKEVRAQYKKLKGVVEMLEEAEKQLGKGYNHKAVDQLDAVLASLHGMDVDSNVFRSTILLKLCRAKAAMKQHEEALDYCEQAYSVLSTPMPGMFVDPHKMREAQEARAEAYMKDNNFDDAVTDLRMALENTSGEKQQDVQRKLNEAQNAQRKWRCVSPQDRKAWQDNRCGHPNPQNGRDHKAVLELPANLHEIPAEKQCDWLKKQYKKLARKWHPDKAKGNKARSARKMNDIAEAKEILDAQLNCKKGRKG